MDYLLFIGISATLIVIPGPNVLLIVATSISHGRGRGLQTVAGTSTAMILQLMIAALSTSWFINELSNGFLWLKWGGVCYLIYLGVSSLIDRRENTSPPLSAVGTFQRGFFVSLTNPKTILFFSAFLPQFVSSAEPYLSQVAILSATFLLLATVLDSYYAVLSAKLVSWLRDSRLSEYQGRLSGLVYICAGSLLAFAKAK